MRKDLISFVSEKKWQIEAKSYGDGRKCWWGSVVLVMLSVARMCDFQFTSSSWQMIRWRPAIKPSQRPATIAKAHKRLPPQRPQRDNVILSVSTHPSKTRKKRKGKIILICFYFFFFHKLFLFEFLIKNNCFHRHSARPPKITSSTSQIKWKR